jgi:hypothetical protein
MRPCIWGGRKEMKEEEKKERPREKNKEKRRTRKKTGPVEAYTGHYWWLLLWVVVVVLSWLSCLGMKKEKEEDRAVEACIVDCPVPHF